MVLLLLNKVLVNYPIARWYNLKSDYSVELIVKDNTGNFKPIIDKCKGSPEDIAIILERKYCNRKSFLSRMFSSLEIAEREMSVFLRNKNK